LVPAFPRTRTLLRIVNGFSFCGDVGGVRRVPTARLEAFTAILRVRRLCRVYHLNQLHLARWAPRRSPSAAFSFAAPQPAVPRRKAAIYGKVSLL
jgi:hypothetical protein